MALVPKFLVEINNHSPRMYLKYSQKTNIQYLNTVYCSIHNILSSASILKYPSKITDFVIAYRISINFKLYVLYYRTIGRLKWQQCFKVADKNRTQS